MQQVRGLERVRNPVDLLRQQIAADKPAPVLVQQFRQPVLFFIRSFSIQGNMPVVAGSDGPDLDLLIKGLKSAGYKLVVATNPLFPLFVQRERISWTGADPDDFDWITSYENSHYSKPNPAYYREILEQIGSLPDNSLMVGNDVREDMEAAASVGIRGFLMTEYLINREDKDISGYPQGGF